jgi:branched-chain amino acid transport system permease protein
VSFVVIQALNGLAIASALFLVASGLSIIFGVSRIVNFAHGSLYMLGAYLAYTLVTTFERTPLGFWSGVVLAALAVGVIGTAMEVLLLRRIYRAPELFQLLATFGVVLMVQDAVRQIWGPVDLLGPRVPGLRGSIEILGSRVPQYDLVLIALGPVVLALTWLVFHRTRWGTLVRAATQDREMVGALGVNQSFLFTSVFFLGAFLAGLGGALQIPREAANLHMDLGIIAEVFVVVVVGGMGSITGAFLAAVMIGQLHAFGIVLFPKITLVLLFLFMAVVLVIRPWGLLGKPDAAARGAAHAPEPPIEPASPSLVRLGLAVLALLLAMPLAAGNYALIILSEALIYTLFAASLHFIMGTGGMVSFGHAAYLGLGAYAAALLVKYFTLPMELALVATPVAAGLGALVFGWFCVRLSGVYLAMLTLAFAQIAWSVAFQWIELTGGDNGILGVWPSAWARDKAAFYYLALAVCGVGVLLLRRFAFAPFGYALRAGRDSRLRADAIGIDVRHQQWLAFALAGAFAGLAGGLFAFFKGSVDPTAMAIPVSIDALVMVLLGGVQTLLGPIAGAAVFTLVKSELLRLTEYWRFVLGLIIVALVLLFPQGLVGALRQWLSGRGLTGRGLVAGWRGL